MKDLVFTFIVYLIGFGFGFLIWGDEIKEQAPNPSPYCEANQIKEFYRLRTYQFHAGEINAQGYKDSLYKDLQTHFILNK